MTRLGTIGRDHGIISRDLKTRLPLNSSFNKLARKSAITILILTPKITNIIRFWKTYENPGKFKANKKLFKPLKTGSTPTRLSKNE
jgi:hypothetical protein